MRVIRSDSFRRRCSLCRLESIEDKPLAELDRYLEEAQKLDPHETVLPIYKDQLAILDLLVPEAAA